MLSLTVMLPSRRAQVKLLKSMLSLTVTLPCRRAQVKLLKSMLSLMVAAGVCGVAGLTSVCRVWASFRVRLATTALSRRCLRPPEPDRSVLNS